MEGIDVAADTEAALTAELEAALKGLHAPAGRGKARWSGALDRVRVLAAEAREVPTIAGMEALAAVGFRPVEKGQDFHNPLRLHLVMACRHGEGGVWFGIPVMWAPMPADCEALLALRRELEAQPQVARRFVDPTRQSG